MEFKKLLRGMSEAPVWQSSQAMVFMLYYLEDFPQG
jgi:hypothetical protein